MHDGDAHSEPVLKVSDRRHFTESGELRPDVERSTFEESTTPAAAATTPPAAAAATPKEAKPAPEGAPRLSKRDVTLEDLLQQLYSVGLMQLGAEIQPGQRGQVDLEGAAGTIDLLGVLEQKTHGNLDSQEERLLASILYDLRLGYVEVQRASNRVQPAAVAPPPPARSRR
ncbi:MAG TPA: DUF1844 domain-containing protein [Terriglobales bacterium]|nr:DUF1844 domain-containing protein [Terriglobales bacterium]